MKLSEVKVGNKAIIEHIDIEEHMLLRLLDLGFINGTLVEVIQSSPSGNPRAYKVRNTIYAIRQSEAQCIEVSEVLDHE
ncbi:ferrous iron transport protein A [Erysipelothrix inopinata]|uniref:Ferrous iron transport protein A n=1 Tax=Erysipelothrix inopinata TaxID=225084 RepID=A0A7G9RX20_9FIRM|nr:FeoA family protein [Erysipelothrix inopinata]QNN60145.1 ferrous iron transport protein A [Erysipelothrix inopinata]